MLIDKKTQQVLIEMGLESSLATLDLFLQLLIEANKTLNLVGRQQSVERLCQLHLLDCLLPWPRFTSFKKIADIGPGGGFPGICWAIVSRETDFLLIEKSPKKSQFLTYVVQELKLDKRVTVVNARVQDCSFAPELIVSRAVAQAGLFLEMTAALDQGQNPQWWLLKALKESIEQELQHLDPSVWSWDIEPLHHPLQDVSRHLMRIKKRGPNASD